jgi:ubiquinone/menaquinone biosynthesis C-methylase UbiE
VGLYERFVLPRLINLACSQRPVLRQRAKVVPLARGRVLELGFGSGLNLPYYDASKVDELWALEPSRAMWTLAAPRVQAVPFAVRFLEAPADRVPLDDASADTVLVTFALCTIPDTREALTEVRRVLKPGGQLVFCEHGAAPDAAVRRWQDRVNPIWRRLAGGCNLNRPIPELIRQAGFRLGDVETLYLPGWRPATFNYWGTAVPGDG